MLLLLSYYDYDLGICAMGEFMVHSLFAEATRGKKMGFGAPQALTEYSEES